MKTKKKIVMSIISLMLFTSCHEQESSFSFVSSNNDSASYSISEEEIKVVITFDTMKEGEDTFTREYIYHKPYKEYQNYSRDYYILQIIILKVFLFFFFSHFGEFCFFFLDELLHG